MSVNPSSSIFSFEEVWESNLQKGSSEEDEEINEKILEKIVSLYDKYAAVYQKSGDAANRDWMILQPSLWWASFDSEEKRPLFLKYLKRLEKLARETLIQPSDLPSFEAMVLKERFYFDASLTHRRGYYEIDQSAFRSRVVQKVESLVKKLPQEDRISETELREKLFQKLKKGNKYKQTICDLGNYPTSIQKITHFLVADEKEYLIIESEQGLYFTKDSDLLKALLKINGMLSGNEITVKEWYFSEESPIKSPGFWDGDWRDEDHAQNKYSQIDALLIGVLEKILYSPLEIPTPKIEKEKMTILELFAGKGDLALKFAKKNEKDLRPYILVDGSPASIEEAKAKLEPFAKHMHVIDRSVDLIHADYRTLVKENPTVIVISGGVTEQVLKERSQGLRCLKKSYALLPDLGFLVLTGLAPSFFCPEELEEIFSCKILNRVFLKSQHWFYVLQKVPGETPPQRRSSVLDLFSYFHYNKRDDRIDLLLKSIDGIDAVRSLDLSETPITPTEFQNLICHFPHLEAVRLCGTQIVSQIVGDLLKLENCVLDVSGTEITDEIAFKLIREGKFRDLIVDGCPNLQLLQQLKIRGFFALKNNPLEPDFSFLTSHFSYQDPELLQTYFESLIGENLLENVQSLFLEDIPLNDGTLVHLIANLGIEKLELINCEENLSLTWLNVYYILKECSLMQGSNWALGLVVQNLENLSRREVGKTLASVLTFLTDAELIDYFCDKITAISFQSGAFPWEKLTLLSRFERLQILDLSDCQLGIETLSLEMLQPLFALPLKQLYIRFTPLETEMEIFIDLLMQTDCPLRNALEILYVNPLISPPEADLPFQVVPVSESEKRLEIGEPEEKIVRLRSRAGFDKRFLDS